MAVTEKDLEVLDSYLDDSLEIGEVDALRARLSGDGELLAALDQIRSERAARRSFFATLEPDDAAVRAVVSKIQVAAARQKRITVRSRVVRSGMLAAACLLVGFYARGLIDRTPSPTHRPGTSLVENKAGVNVRKVSTYQVTLRDETGKIVAVQRFDSMEKAQEFAADLARWQSHSERLASGRFVLSADRF